ncbi:transmembrane signal receptor [Lithospermum erythrorhizon]|uniref:Transmembrane signal receptor n=1 Tax=Lithospermum erythrorhizon TaxID=34254 RepID=A0AAV3PG75_LITER
MDGMFLVKSDVFSFGVLLLEIISGQKNNWGFYRTNGKINLLAHAWKLLSEGRGLELLDPKAGDSYSSLQVLRCIQVGLLCIQEQAEDRPSMGNVALMLSSESISLPQPKYPGFCMGRAYMKSSLSSSSMVNSESCTINHVTITMLEGR